MQRQINFCYIWASLYHCLHSPLQHSFNDSLFKNTFLFFQHPLVLIFIIRLNWFDVVTQVQAGCVLGWPWCCFKVFIIMTVKACLLKFQIPFSLGWNWFCKWTVAREESNPASYHRGGTKSVLIIRNMVSIEDVNCTDSWLSGELPGISCRDNKN